MHSPKSVQNKFDHFSVTNFFGARRVCFRSLNAVITCEQAISQSQCISLQVISALQFFNHKLNSKSAWSIVPL